MGSKDGTYLTQGLSKLLNVHSTNPRPISAPYAIHDDDYDYDDDDDDDYSFENRTLCNDDDSIIQDPPKWSLVKGFFSMFSKTTHTHQPQFLSYYGKLLKKPIGEGVSATVHLIQKPQGQCLVVKIFRKHTGKEAKSSYTKAITSEFCITSSLNHENILKTIDFVKLDSDHKRFCIVMEYCPEGDLYSYIKQGTMKENQIHLFFKQLLMGLNYLHSLGVAHRDIKPENLLISNGKLKIADFGSADVFRVAWEKHDRQSDGLCGTTPYMAPEIFSCPRYWAAPVDVWAAGIILFCMKFDGVPFGSATLKDTNFPIYLRTRPTRQYTPFNKFNAEPRKVIYAMLNPDPNRRVTIQDVLKMPWMQTVYY